MEQAVSERMPMGSGPDGYGLCVMLSLFPVTGCPPPLGVTMSAPFGSRPAPPPSGCGDLTRVRGLLRRPAALPWCGFHGMALPLLTPSPLMTSHRSTMDEGEVTRHSVPDPAGPTNTHGPAYRRRP